MFGGALILVLMSIILIEEISAEIIYDNAEKVYYNSKYLTKFNISLKNRKTEAARLDIKWHARKPFPKDLEFQSKAIIYLPDGMHVTMGSYITKICKPIQECLLLPQYLKDLRSGDSCIVKLTEEHFEDAGLFNIETLMKTQHMYYHYSIVNLNTITTAGVIIVQYKITATHYVDQDIQLGVNVNDENFYSFCDEELLQLLKHQFEINKILRFIRAYNFQKGMLVKENNDLATI